MSAEWKAGVSAAGSLVVWDGEDWRWADCGAACVDQPPANMRPLVLIDPEDREQVRRLLNLYYNDVATGAPDTRDMQAALREYASPTPPKPEEPMGLGAVVVDADGIKWVRADDDDMPWMRAGGSGDTWWNYADIAVVEVLSAGVES